MTGTVLVPGGSTPAPAALGILRPRAVGTTPFANAQVQVVDYATGLEFPLNPAAYTDNTGRYSVSLPKGKDFILYFKKTVTGGLTERLSTVVPKSFDNQVVNADFTTSLVAESLGATLGQAGSLSQKWVDDLTTAVVAVGATVTDNSFTIGSGTAIIGNAINAGLDTTNTTAALIQDNVIHLVTSVLVPPPGKPVPSVTTGNGQLTLTWAAIDNASQYHVYRKSAKGVTRVANDCAFTTTQATYTDTGLANDTAYYYVVTAEGAGGEGAESAEVAGTPKAPVAGVPSNVGVAPGSGQITINWQAVDNAASYAIYWSTTAGVTKTTGTKISGISATTYTHTGLTNGTVYYYIVTAVVGSTESAASAVVSGAPEYVAPPATGLADGKAMIQDLRDTAQSLTDYRRTGTGGVLDNAVVGLRAQVDNVIVPYMTGVGQAFEDFATPAMIALSDSGLYPTGENFIYNASLDDLVATGGRSDGKLVITTSGGLTITLSPISSTAGAEFAPMNFTVTSASDNTLDYRGTFDNIVTRTISSGGESMTAVVGAGVSGSFASEAIGTGANKLTFNANLNISFNASDDVTGIQAGIGLDTQYLRGTTQMSITGLIPKGLYTGTDNNINAQGSQLKLSNASLEVKGKGVFTGNFQIDLVPSKTSTEYFLVSAADNVSYATLELFWDERSSTAKLLDVDFGYPEGENMMPPVDTPVLWYHQGNWSSFGQTLLAAPATYSGGQWNLTKKFVSGNSLSTGSSITFALTGSGTSRSVTGTVTNPSWAAYELQSIPFHTVAYLSKDTYNVIPVSATFYGSYENKDTSITLGKVEGNLTVTFLNPTAADPFIIGEYEAFSASKDNFPRARLEFTGKITTSPLHPAINVNITSENRFVAAGTAGLPSADRPYIVVDATANYSDNRESLRGTGTIYNYMLPEIDGNVHLAFETATVEFTNAKGITIHVVDSKANGVTGNMKSGNTLLGSLAEMQGMPIIRWSDGTFDSLP